MRTNNKLLKYEKCFLSALTQFKSGMLNTSFGKLHYKAGITLIIIILLLFNVAHAQPGSIKPANKKAVKWYQKATSAYKSDDKNEALELVNKSIGKDKNYVEAYLLKGDILTEMKKPRQAILSYEKAVSIDSSFFPPVWYFLGNLYYNVGNYRQSKQALTTFLTMKGISSTQRSLGKKRLAIAKAACRLKENPVKVQINKLNSSINTDEDEYVNYVAAGNRKLIFTRKEKVTDLNIKSAGWIEQFYFAKQEDTTWAAPEPWVIPWAKERNVGALSLTVDGLGMYFTGCRWPRSYGGCDVYYSEKNGNSWRNPVNLGASVNSTAWDSQPYVSSDGKLLLFSSSRKGGYGGSDIWMSVRLKDNSWSLPVNLGDSVNTPGNEMAPFLYADNKTLLFSSDGWPGLGKQDIFISRKNKAGAWSKAVNIGYPVNTGQAEINMIYGLDGQQVWLSSKREGGSFDIYRLPVYDVIKPNRIIYFEGRVLDSVNLKPVRAKVMLTDAITGFNLLTKYSQPASGFFLVVMEPGKTYGFNIVAKGYLFYSERFTPGENDTIADSLNKEFLLKPIAKGSSVILKNLYFDVDSANLKPVSFPELKKLILFLQINPKVELEIAGHTDNSGSVAHNMQLSLHRAESVYQYLIKKGIDPDRLSFKGYGSREPIANNASEAGRARNRRVVITVR